MIRIYKLDSDIDDELVYYGKTTLSLTKRLIIHRSPSTKCTSKQLFEKYGCGNVKITLLEECEDEKEGSERERYYIQNFPCVNRCLPLRTYEQWFDENKEYRKAYHKMNDKRRAEKRKEKIRCECGKEISKRHRNEHYKTKCHQAFMSQNALDPKIPNLLPSV